ncbi:PREDICTED: pupal cuticle protein-like [Drosophila arizonae]|uniref:Pupal cuticle protein-like n=1 Tax=Drosophila arizonae TaxID=7263 RepID=A0ABM1P092_DROAR|nr:PREDICTED: pupal cuticle protein-like [Drosophila arizonae]
MMLLIVSALIACAYARPLDDAHATGQGYSYPKPIGSYFYPSTTANGISAQEQGVLGKRVTGSYYYYTPEGELIKITYIADVIGYQPQITTQSLSPCTVKSLCG